jgi:protocatechuate 3,4-dioxygenase beta subunit
VALAGRVADERGGPVVGATVTLWAGGERAMFLDATAARGVPQSRDDQADGSFRFEGASPEGNRLRVEAPAFATLERLAGPRRRARAFTDAGARPGPARHR